MWNTSLIIFLCVYDIEFWQKKKLWVSNITHTVAHTHKLIINKYLQAKNMIQPYTQSDIALRLFILLN